MTVGSHKGDSSAYAGIEQLNEFQIFSFGCSYGSTLPSANLGRVVLPWIGHQYRGYVRDSKLTDPEETKI